MADITEITQSVFADHFNTDSASDFNPEKFIGALCAKLKVITDEVNDTNMVIETTDPNASTQTVIIQEMGITYKSKKYYLIIKFKRGTKTHEGRVELAME